MGDRLRKYTKQLLKIAFQAAMPALLIYGILIGSFVVRGTPHDAEFAPLVYLRLLLVCYLTAFITTCVLNFKSMIHASLRADEHLIGNCFGGFRKQDKLFCEGMEAYAANRTRSALELFLSVQEFDLTVWLLHRCAGVFFFRCIFYHKAKDLLCPEQVFFCAQSSPPESVFCISTAASSGCE